MLLELLLQQLAREEESQTHTHTHQDQIPYSTMLMESLSNMLATRHQWVAQLYCMMLLRKYFWVKDVKYLCFLHGVGQGLEGLICINIQLFTYLVFKLQSSPFICAEVLNRKDAIHQALHAGNLLFPALLKDCIALPLKLVLAHLFIPHGIIIL